MEEKLARWFFFGVLFSLLPFTISFLNIKARKETFRLAGLFERGELLLVSTAIGAGAFGELFGVNSTHAIAKIIISGTTVIVVTIQAFWYSNVSTPGNKFDPDFVGKVSGILFVLTIIASVACLLLAGA